MGMVEVELVSSFAGGVFAALVGPLPALILTGIFIVIGAAIVMGGGEPAFLNIVGLGPFFGPHISWAAGLVALAYAGRKGLLGGQEITVPLIKFKQADVIVVGGIFGALAHVINYGLAQVMGTQGNSIALTVFIICALGRLIFGRTGLLGCPEGRKRVAPKSETLLFNLITGFTFGFLNGYVALATGQAVLGFGIALAALVFLQAGAEDCPILHNVALIAATTALATQNLYLAGLLGMATIVVEEILHNLFINDGDTLIDTWGTSIAVMSFVVSAL
jgi:hypothetical protein